MTTTFIGITTIQDNILSGVDLLTINNPLSFIVEVEYSGDKPSRIPVEMSVNGSIVDTYDAIPFKDTSTTTRQFIFMANEYVKSFMPTYFDELITSGSAKEVVPTEIDLEFIAYPFSETISFRAIDGASQFSDTNGACATDIYNNEYNYWFSQYGGFCYIYFYAKPTVEGTTGTCVVNVNGTDYNIGEIVTNRFYRFKVVTDWKGLASFTVTRTDVGGEPTIPNTFLTGYIYSFDLCEPKILKYYDSNGQYRFIPLFLGSENNKYKTNGVVSKFVTSLVTDSSDTYVRGKDKEKTLLLNLVNFPKDKISIIEDLLTSPYVYLHNNDSLTSDELTDWLMVEVMNTSLRISKRGEFISTSIEVKLPKIYTITT